VSAQPAVVPTFQQSTLEEIAYTIRGHFDEHGKPRRYVCPDWTEIPGELPRKVTCKRRGCPRCGRNWARDVVRITHENLDAFVHAMTTAGTIYSAVVMVTITAPGEDRLPWDEAHCAHRRPHRHRGPAGCRVQERAAREWSDTLTWRWEKLRSAARLATRRDLSAPSGELGPAPIILARFYEPQKRGVPHLHVVVAYGTEAQRDAAHVFVGHLKRLVGEYDFGFADGRGKLSREDRGTTATRHGVELRPRTGQDVARYLSSYLTGRDSKKKNTIRENLADPVMPRSLFWITPALSSLSESERIAALRERVGVPAGTGVTMRWLRKARHMWAALEGRVEAPTWARTEDAVIAAVVYLRIYRRRPPPTDLAPALETARRIDRDVWRLGRWDTYGPQMLDFALQLVEACIPSEPEEAAA
jgi:hypothetical protein